MKAAYDFIIVVVAAMNEQPSSLMTREVAHKDLANNGAALMKT